MSRRAIKSIPGPNGIIATMPSTIDSRHGERSRPNHSTLDHGQQLDSSQLGRERSQPIPQPISQLSRKQRRLQRRKSLHKLISSDLIGRVSEEEYRTKVKRVYGGPKGALLTTASMLSLHLPLGERLFRSRKFDLRGLRSILDVGSGAGQIARHLLKYSDPEAKITCTDLSHPMLRRARHRMKLRKSEFVTADLTRFAVRRRFVRLYHLRICARTPFGSPAGARRNGPSPTNRRPYATPDH